MARPRRAPDAVDDAADRADRRARAAEFGRIAEESFGMPPDRRALARSAVGRAGWTHYMGFDGETPVSSRRCTSPRTSRGSGSGRRSRRRAGGAASPRCSRARLRDARRPGCRWAVTETGKETEEEPGQPLLPEHAAGRLPARLRAPQLGARHRAGLRRPRRAPSRPSRARPSRRATRSRRHRGGAAPRARCCRRRSGRSRPGGRPRPGPGDRRRAGRRSPGRRPAIDRTSGRRIRSTDDGGADLRNAGRSSSGWPTPVSPQSSIVSRPGTPRTLPGW